MADPRRCADDPIRDRPRARSYFDLGDSAGFHRDDVGDDFNSFEDARAQAQALRPDIAREALPDGETHVIICDVRDASDRVVHRGRLPYEGLRGPT